MEHLVLEFLTLGQEFDGNRIISGSCSLVNIVMMSSDSWYCSEKTLVVWGVSFDYATLLI